MRWIEYSVYVLLVRLPLLQEVIVDLSALHAIDETLSILESERVLHFLLCVDVLETVLVGMVNDIHLLL
jgi:hypothetical protein